MGSSLTRILIVGAGSLGKRHAESISKTGLREGLIVVDPHEPSRVECSRVLRLSSPPSSLEIPVMNLLPADVANFEVAIISCSSNERLQVTRDLLGKGFRGHLVLEKLINPVKGALDEFDLLIRNSAVSSVWVNMPMAFFPQFDVLSESLPNKSEINSYRVVGSNYGLVTNAVHYIDHVLSMIVFDPRHQLEFSLDSLIVEAKRPGYSEVIGSLSGKIGETDFYVADSPIAGENGTTITMGFPGRSWMFREDEGKGECDGKVFKYQIPLQSDSSSIFVTDLLVGNTPKLRPFNEAVTSHRILFEALDNLVKVKSGDQANVRFT